MASRESGRIREADKKRVLDEASRKRRARKALEALEQDNYHEDPHADLVMSKKIPKFQDNLDGSNNSKKKAKRSKGADYYRAKYRKTFRNFWRRTGCNGRMHRTTSRQPPGHRSCRSGISALFVAFRPAIPVRPVAPGTVVCAAWEPTRTPGASNGRPNYA